MLAQVPSVIFFLAKWAIREPKQTAIVFGLQVAAFVAAAVPVFILGK
jgi:hypothetical protein